MRQAGCSCTVACVCQKSELDRDSPFFRTLPPDFACSWIYAGQIESCGPEPEPPPPLTFGRAPAACYGVLL